MSLEAEQAFLRKQRLTLLKLIGHVDIKYVAYADENLKDMKAAELREYVLDNWDRHREIIEARVDYWVEHAITGEIHDDEIDDDDDPF